MSRFTFQPLADSWCQSVCELVTTDFEWNIQQLAFLHSSEKWIYPCTSSFSSAKDNIDYVWRLDLRDEGQNIRIYLNRYTKVSGNAPTGNPVRVKFAILGKTRQQLFKQVFVLPTTTSISSVFYSLSKNLMRESDCLQTDKSLIVYCKIEILIYKGTELGVKAAEVSDLPFSDGDQLLRTQMEQLFESKALNDVTLDVSGRHFQAHKSILASRSKVFAAMFVHETKEKLSNHVQIDDIEPDVFQEVLRFIYTGRLSLETMDMMATGLLAAADKYLLDQLKTECENHLIRRISPENCLDLLFLTDRHPASHLKKYALDVFRRFPTEVMRTDSWTRAKQDNAAWLCDIVQMVFSPAS
ncbi:hypothetical protein GHT06_016348 [Daphnia sinensis]|uniref:BTB domain-containing protein n=1 Tax=Daphnia sinensis TaxID=1820382 RepID=A0AAD5PSX4_9CRUS|nr:hypothetical protein GHT06_016348 [Daphnia sinensis]